MSKKNKTNDSKRNQCCELTIDIKIKKVNKDTIKNDKKYLKRDVPLPAIITIRNSHNHETKMNYEALGYLRPTEKTKETFKDYFNNGMGPGEAKRLHEAKLLMKDDGEVLIANTSINPTRREVTYLYDLRRESLFGKDWAGDPIGKLREKIQEYKEQGKR